MANSDVFDPRNTPSFHLKALETDKPTARSSGHQSLDGLLPAGGWRRGGVVELISKLAGCGELKLLMPHLAAASQQGEQISLIQPPQAIYPPAWAAHGVNVSLLSSVPSATPRDALLDIDRQIAKHRGGTVVAWIDQALPNNVLRYLATRARQFNANLFLLRVDQRCEASYCQDVLRLFLTPCQSGLGVTLAHDKAPTRQQMAFVPLATSIRQEPPRRKTASTRHLIHGAFVDAASAMPLAA